MSGQQTGNDYDLHTVTGAARSDGGLPQGTLLNAFVEAVIARDDDAVATARAHVVETLGERAMVDAAAVIAAFNAYPRAADATGLPLEDAKKELTAEMRAELGLDALNTSEVA